MFLQSIQPNADIDLSYMTAIKLLQEYQARGQHSRFLISAKLRNGASVR